MASSKWPAPPASAQGPFHYLPSAAKTALQCALLIYANWQAVNGKACSLADIRGTDEVSPQSPFRFGN